MQPRRQERESAHKTEVTVFNNLIMEVKSHAFAVFYGQDREGSHRAGSRSRGDKKVVNTRGWAGRAPRGCLPY